ncbi:metal-dependent hydrolase [Halogeometricum sp. S1BR25-6]|uniref:Metal-dependent hydrolase n=1 Tax=Halogeometricum salsisoli TaxID=2950536 RepID=A0ABU2GIZ6_9EURY|nr:metal-dependent hydrolase [Halogeometricum sp. S1BR25-6]MDS0300244.1 metal-dependent hydrolase [Halogeometricum sp. S1BR25-6]
MLPWGHAAFGYVLYSLYARLRLNHPPQGLAVLALAVGTQFPDLIDKPLTWTFAVLPYGRSFAHSLFTLVPLLAILWMAFDTPKQRTLTTAFGIGYASHLVGDNIGGFLNGEFSIPGYLLWPLTDVPSEGKRSFLEFFLNLQFSPTILFGFVLALFTLGLWIYDGMPGVKDVLEGRLWEKSRTRPTEKR